MSHYTMLYKHAKRKRNCSGAFYFLVQFSSCWGIVNETIIVLSFVKYMR